MMCRLSVSVVCSLLMIVCCTLVSEVAGICRYGTFNQSFENCISNRKYLTERLPIKTILDFFKYDIPQSCIRFYNVTRCVKEVIRDCPTDSRNPYRKAWPKVETGVTYICEEKRQVFVSNIACLGKQEIPSSVSHCQAILDKDMHSARRRHARHTCEAFNGALKCVQKVVLDHCGSEAAKATEQVVRIFLSLVDVDHDCDHNSSSDAQTGGSLVLNFVLSAALMMVFFN